MTGPGKHFGSEEAGRRRRGALLLEVMLSIALFVMFGLIISSIVGGALDSLEAARRRHDAVDLVRSAMSRIEAGISSPESLNGPVQAWSESAGMNASPDVPQQSKWDLRVETTPSQFTGLTVVSISAVRTDQAGGDGRAEYTLRQLVRLSQTGLGGAGSAAGAPGGGV